MLQVIENMATLIPQWIVRRNRKLEKKKKISQEKYEF